MRRRRDPRFMAKLHARVSPGLRPRSPYHASLLAPRKEEKIASRLKDDEEKDGALFHYFPPPSSVMMKLLDAW